MGKHYFHETTYDENTVYERVLFCEWCGLVVWLFSKQLEPNSKLQEKAGSECKANPTTQKDKGDGDE